MFEDYLKDADYFFEEGIKLSHRGDEDKARRFFRVAVFCVMSAMESYINYCAKGFLEAETSKVNIMSELEICFLNDEEQYFSPEKGILKRQKYNPVEDKVKSLLFRFCPNYKISTESSWSGFLEFKKFRNSLIHSRAIDDDTPLNKYETQIKKGLASVIKIMDTLSLGMTKRHLRKQILDLLPDP